MTITASKRFLAALVAGLAAALTATGASAAVWEWACQGELGDLRILFDRDGLYIATGKAPAGKPGKLTRQLIVEAIAAVKKADGFTAFRSDDENGGFASSISFSRTDEGKQTRKVVLTERSSKQISHQERPIFCGTRDEYTDLYRKIYRYERDGEPPRDVAMQCMEYQLTTRGGRKGC